MLMPHDDGHFFFNDSATTALYPYGHTLSLHDALPILSCRRSSSTSIAGWPGALASSGSDGADRTAQRVWAVLGAGRAETLSSRTVTPDVSAASPRRRLAVRSRCRGLRQSPTPATPPSGQRPTSAAARRPPRRRGTHHKNSQPG